MADTLTFKKVFTGHTATDTQFVTDGTDIFWESGSFRGSIYKYTVSSDTVSKIVDAASFDLEDGVSFGSNITLMVYASNIYVGIWIDVAAGGWDIGDRVGKVYQVTPTGTVTTVIDRVVESTNVINGTFRGYNLKLHSTENHIVATGIEWPSAGSPDAAEFKSQWSTNGTSWGNATKGFGETIDIGAVDHQGASGKDYRALGIYDRFPTSAANSVILKFVNGVWSKVAGPSPNATFPLFEVGPVHFWTDDDLSKYTDDFSTFHEPSSQNPSTLTLNMPWALGNNNGSGSDERFVKLDTDNPPTTLITDSDMATDGVAIGVHTDVHIRTNDGTGWLVVKAFGATFPNWSIWERDTNLGATPGGWGGGGSQSEAPESNRPCDINADGTFLYICAITVPTATPVLLKQEVGLTENAELVYDPMDGTDIGVMCGRFDADVIWAAGFFGGTDVVVKTEDAGDTFEIKDPGSFGSVTGFVVGPDSDDRILIADNNDTIQESENSGTDWTEINGGTGFTTNAIARLNTNVQESVFGNDSGAVDNVDYSVNSGVDMEDFSTGFPTEDTTGLIVN